MVLSELAEVAVVVPKPREGELYQLAEDVGCNACGSVEITLCDETIICAHCFDLICVLCGCVERWACDDGCSWILPGVCSTHEGDPRLARLAVPGTARSTLGMLN